MNLSTGAEQQVGAWNRRSPASELPSWKAFAVNTQHNKQRRSNWWLCRSGHTDSKKARWQLCHASTPVDAIWPQRKRTTKEPRLEERSGEGDVDSRIQVQMEEDGGGSTVQSLRWIRMVWEWQGLKTQLTTHGQCDATPAVTFPTAEHSYHLDGTNLYWLMPRQTHITFIWRHMPHTAAAAALFESQTRAGVQPTGRRLSLHTQTLTCDKTAIRSPGLLLVSTPIIHVIKFTDHGGMEGWVGLVGWPTVDTLPSKWSHVNHRSGIDQGKSASQRPTS